MHAHQAAAAYDVATPSQDDLQVILHEHALWLSSNGRDGKRANFRGMDLHGVNMQDMHLPEASFRGANMTGVNLSRANLQGADMAESVMNNANFRDADLEGANFARCSAAGAYFEHANLKSAVLSTGNYNSANFVRSDLSFATMRDVNMERCNMTGANLQDANLRHANFSEAILNEADLSNANCREATFDYAKMNKTTLNHTVLKGAGFEHVSFVGSDFSNAIDLDIAYQYRAFENEKEHIVHEMDNLQKVREQISVFERSLHEERQRLNQRKRMIADLEVIENEIDGGLITYAGTFRNISMMWFMLVAGFATVAAFYFSKVGWSVLKPIEIFIVVTMLLSMLGILGYSAIKSFYVSKHFAKLIRMRREKLQDEIFLDDDLMRFDVSMPKEVEVKLNLAPHPARSKNGTAQPEITYL